MNRNLEQYQDQICAMCEIKFFGGCSHMSYHFMCEGCRCEDAYKMFEESDDYLDILMENSINLIDKLLKDD